MLFWVVPIVIETVSEEWDWWKYKENEEIKEKSRQSDEKEISRKEELLGRSRKKERKRGRIYE